MNFEAFLHFQEKHRAFLEEEEFRKLQAKESVTIKTQTDIIPTNPSDSKKKDTP